MKKNRPIICFFLMLDPRFKTLCLVSSLIHHEQGKAIVEEYDKRVLLIKGLKRIKVWISFR
jgi:hypothetical protein